MVKSPSNYYKDKNIAKNYDQERFSSLAGRTFNELEKRNIRKAFRALDYKATIVDVPCGTGRLAEVLLEEGFRVIGMDISAAMLEQAKLRLTRFGERFTCQVVDMLDPHLVIQERYDAALCARVLMHFPLDDQIIFLRNVASMISERVVFTQSWVSNYQRARRKLKSLLHHQDPVNYPISSIDLTRLLTGAGLRELKRIRPCSLITEEIIVIAGR